MGEPEPKPCPFCGHGMPDHLQLPHESGWRVVCESCDAMGPEEASIADATLAWNTRKEVSRG